MRHDVGAYFGVSFDRMCRGRCTLTCGALASHQGQDREKDDTLWYGQAFKLRHGGCIYEKVEARSKWIGRTEFTRGDYALAVKWWLKDSNDPEERTIEEWQPSAADKEACGIEQGDDVFFVVNSTELRDVGFQMDALDPPPVPVAVARRTRSASAEPVRAATSGRRFRVCRRT